ncbi:MAG: hypothetical protein KA536_06555 [Saprospiraceae bacterium]|nr:hypothetical protein [Saprospiraceae bacterium]
MESNFSMTVIIEGHKSEFENDPDFQNINSQLNRINWLDNMETYCFEINYQPTFELIRNQFSFETKRNLSTEFNIPYNFYLSSEKIKSLSYWEYEGEKIYGLTILRTDNYGYEEDWYSARSQDLVTITTGLLEYLLDHKLLFEHDLAYREIQLLNLVSLFSFKFNYEIKFYTPDY